MPRFRRTSVCTLLLLAGCVSSRPSHYETQAPQELLSAEGKFRKEYVWAPGDQLEVVVRDAPEVSRTVVVRPDGFISLPLLDDVAAAGLTPTELKDSLTAKFGRRLNNPEVTVIAVQVPPPMVYVVGEVNNNTGVPLRNAPTAIQAITLAGGMRKSAKPGNTVIIRLGEDGVLRAIPVDDSAGGQPGSIMGLREQLLQPDDIIFVPESGRSQVVRFLDDVVNRPLQAITGIIGVYFQFRLIKVISEK